MKNTYTKDDIEIARKIWTSADDDTGMVSGRGIAPHGSPELHGQMLDSDLFFRLTGKEWDAERFNLQFAKY